jgi:hypothetical protein
MKKIVLAAALSSKLLLAGSITDILGSIGDFYNPITQIDSVAGAELFGMCYKRQNFTIDVCGTLPSISNIGFDGCSALPNIPGFNKLSSNMDLQNNIALNSYCNNVANKINNVIGDIDIYSAEDGKKKYPGGDTAEQFYNGAVNQIVSKTSLVKENFLGGNNKVVSEVLNYAKVKGIQDVTTVKATDLKAPASYQSYLDEREALSKLTVSDIVANTPLSVSTGVTSKIVGIEGAAAKNLTEDYIKQATETISMNTSKRVGFEIDLQRKDTDFAIPTQETINLYADEKKPEKIALLKQQIKREAKIRADVILKDKLRADIVALVSQKAVIMNEKFDRAAARSEIENLLKD